MSPKPRSMTSALADQPVRLLAVAAGLALSLSACSSSTEDTGQELDATTEETVTSTTSTVSTTTSTEATTTTLSELQIAEAEVEVEVEQVVIDWWTFPLDTSQEGSAEGQREFTTGLLFQRDVEYLASLEADGLVLRILETPPIQITETTIDLEGGMAEVTACEGSTGTLVDAETQEVVQAGDPDDTAVSTFQLQLVESEWKINEYLPTSITENPIPCEINP